MLPRDPLPTDEQRRRLCEMIAAAFVEIRLLGWEGKAQQAGDLADAFHNVPREMYGWGKWSRHIFRGMLEHYQHKYPTEESGGRDYVAMFDEVFGHEEPGKAYEWLAPWQSVGSPEAKKLEAELHKKLSPAHPLHGRAVSALGRRSDRDDVLFAVRGGGPMLAVVHLTWRGSPEPDPAWPHTTFYGMMEDWLRRCLLPDHEEWSHGVERGQ